MGQYRNGGLFTLVAAIWGLSFVATKAGLADLPPVLFAAARFDVAAVVLFGYLWATGTAWRPRTRDDWVAIFAGGVFIIAGHHALLFAGQQYVTSALAAVLLGLIPVITPAFTRVLAPDERLTPRLAVGLGLGFVGVVIIANPDPRNLLTVGLVGVGLVFASAVVFVLGAVVTYSRDPSLSVVGVQAWMTLLGAGLLHATSVALPTESLAAAVWSPTALAAVMYMGVGAGALAFFLYFVLLGRLGPVEVAFIDYVAPLFAAVAGWLLLAETVTATTVVGFVVILTSFLVTKAPAIRAELLRIRNGRGRLDSSD
jgi:drug/metabolite transporter (DMT)-like permease